MPSLTQWLSDRLSGVVEPKQKKRIQDLADVIQRHLEANQQRFTMRAVLASTPYDPLDLPLATECVLRRFIERFWADEHFSPQEMRTADWLATKLDVPPNRMLEINLETAKEIFGRALAQAMEDGVLDAHEEQRLTKIAGSVGRTPAQLGARFFRANGAMFLRAIFSRMVEDESVTRDAWSKLFATAEKLGLRKEEVLTAIGPQAQSAAEMFLAEAKLDGLLSAQEEAGLDWMTAEWGLPSAFIDYLHQETARLRAITRIAEGALPTVAAPRSVSLGRGETAHFTGPTELLDETNSATGQGAGRRSGVVVLTNTRLIVTTGAESRDVPYKAIRSHRLGRNFIRLALEDASTITLIFDDPALPHAVLHTALALANGSAPGAGEPTPVIPRDVLQRVWMRSEGKCVECGATDYLEFDHIASVAEGGASADQNLRLLCRRCEAKNTDFV